MTVNNAANKVIAAGNGVQTVFGFSFIAVAASDISVILTDASGNLTTLAPTNYSIALNPAPAGQIWSLGGTVTYPLTGSPIPAGSTLTIARTLPLTQLVALSNQGNQFPSAVETALDTLEMQLQQISELFQRAMVAPITDPSALLPLPAAAARAGKALVFDSLGNPVAGAIPASGVISSAMQPVVAAATILLGLNLLAGAPTSTAQIGTITSQSNSVARTVASKLNDFITFLDFGAVGDGVTDDTAAVQRAINACGGRTLSGAGLSYLITTTLVGVSNIEIVNAKLIQSTHAAHPIIAFTAGQTNWQLRKIWFAGDGATDLNYVVSWQGAIAFDNPTGFATANIAIEQCNFTAFSDNYIVNGNLTGTAGTENFRFRLNTLDSTLPIYVDQTRLWLSLFATSGNANAKYFDTLIEDNFANANALTICMALWSGHDRFTVQRNFILNPGAHSAFNPVVGSHNCYGIIAYDGSGTSPGINGDISCNFILNPPSAGIYTAGDGTVAIHDNWIYGQFRTDEATLARAGISLTGPTDHRVYGNRMLNCWGGLAVVAVPGSTTIETFNNEITGNAAVDSYGIRLGATNGTTTASTIVVRDSRITLSGASSIGIRQVTDAGNYLGSIIILDNDFSSPSVGIGLSSVFAAGKIEIGRNRYAGVFASAMVLAESISAKLVVHDETWDLITATGRAFDGGNSSALSLRNCVVMNRSSGIEALTMGGAQGTVDGIEFLFVGAAFRIVAGSLGYAIPGFNGNPGDVVQTLAGDSYTQAGTPGAKYVVPKWICNSGSTWYPWHVLTGN